MQTLPNDMRCILKNILAIREKFDVEDNDGEVMRLDDDIRKLFRSNNAHGFS